jgi:hypothetical protein
MPVGLPYVLPGSRPSKNGQPSKCISQCAPNVGVRKVGGDVNKIPLYWAGKKTKDEILDKWDPVSRRVVRYYIHRKTGLAIYDGGGATNPPDCALDGNGTNVVYDGGGPGTILCN